VFVSHRDATSLLAIDVAADGLSFLRHTVVKVDREARAVSATLFGLATRTAQYREGQGCALFATGAGPHALRAGSAADRTIERPVAADELDVEYSTRLATSGPGLRLSECKVRCGLRIPQCGISELKGPVCPS
jgi:hypothetical protein